MPTADHALRSGLDRRQMMLGGAMLATAAVAAAKVPSKAIDLLGAQSLEKIIPVRVGSWQVYSNSGLVVPPEDELSQQLYAQLLTRTYVSPDQPPVMLLIASSAGQTGVLQIHRPEVCYPAGGYTLGWNPRIPIAAGRRDFNAASFTATGGNRIEQLIYWTRVGDDMPQTWLEQRLAVATANLRGFIPDAVLTRVSTISPDQDASRAVLAAFSRELLLSVPPNVRSFLVGEG